uniref:solute carrier family 45 member 4 isoform X1 n=1 Tax=Ciona intestinalis TaxID=7719 RepID=UPI000180B509|nr:solute carrier family 45 member 4 isoform X1 [Ciona intestinalis]|eukprot:XP_026694725.1 solute carrier family 45 member 4 isoform X1 [Ciona intestinalis]
MDEGGDESIEPSSSEQTDGATASSVSAQKRHKWTRLLLHASIMCGREFLYAVEIVLVTPIILQLGMPEKYYSLMWMFSPVLGILIGPIMGSHSDRCKSRFGRRRPYITALVIGALIGLTLLIFSKDIASSLGGENVESRRVWGVVVGVVGAQIMDFCLDQAETPLRAYTLDVCTLPDQQRAVAMQTFFIGLGGALGFIIDGIDWEKTAISKLFGSQIKVVYMFAVVTYILTTICNLCSIKETPWHKRSKPSSSKCIIPSQLPPEKSNGLENTSTYANDKLEEEGNSLLGKENNTDPISVNVEVHGTGSHHGTNNHSADPPNSRPITLFPRISMSKGLFISMSCPSGLNEPLQNDESLSSLTTSDSACDDDITTTSEEANADDFSFSVPNLNVKNQKNNGLLDYVRSKQFLNATSNNLENRQSWTHGVTEVQNSIVISDKLKSNTENEGLKTNKISSESNNNRTKPDKPCNSENGNIQKTFTTSNGKDVVRKLDYCEEKGKTKLTEEKDILKKRENGKNKKKEVDDDNPVSFKQLWLSIVTMPSSLRWLCLAQLLGFIGMETVFLWYTDMMGREVYKGDPQASENSTELKLYNDGVKMGCWGLAIDSIAMVVFSVAMERGTLLNKIRLRKLYSGGFLLMFITGLLMFFFTNQIVILSLSWCIGVTFAIMLTVPYVLVGKYHQNKQYTMLSPGKSKRGFGLDCAILACQMYVGNVGASAISSPIIHLFGTVKAMLLIMSICHILAFIVAYFFVLYPGEVTLCCKKEDVA